MEKVGKIITRASNTNHLRPKDIFGIESLEIRLSLEQYEGMVVVALNRTFWAQVLLFSLLLVYPAVAASPINYEGTRLGAYQGSLSQVFPEGEDFKEVVVTPKQLGGTTFVGLVVRLLGDQPNKKYEGMSTPRAIYEVYKDKKMIGIAHGASFETPAGLASAFVFYDMKGVIRNLRLDNVPDNILKKLHEENFIQQFIGQKLEDFEKQTRYRRVRGRKKTYWEKGKFLTDAKEPKSGELKSYWTKLVRSVRFNAAFMDVAFFISRHPELDDHERISNKAISGPEIKVRGTTLLTPDNNDRMIIQAAPGSAVDPASNN
ncbi:hypothetical protein GW915_02525 [bacterium]|nr:hypothetical protein [bacterium]